MSLSLRTFGPTMISDAIDENIRHAQVNGHSVSSLKWALSHNSYNNVNDITMHRDFEKFLRSISTIDINQIYSIQDQFSIGVRAFELDAHYSKAPEVVFAHNGHVQSLGDVMWKGARASELLNRLAVELAQKPEPTVVIIKFENFVSQEDLLAAIQESVLNEYWCKRTTHLKLGADTSVAKVNLKDVEKAETGMKHKVLLCHSPRNLGYLTAEGKDPDTPHSPFSDEVFGWSDSVMTREFSGNPDSWVDTGMCSGVVTPDPSLFKPDPTTKEFQRPFLDMNLVEKYDPRVAFVADKYHKSGEDLLPGEMLVGSMKDDKNRNHLRIMQNNGGLLVSGHDGKPYVTGRAENYKSGTDCTALVMNPEGRLERHIFRCAPWLDLAGVISEVLPDATWAQYAKLYMYKAHEVEYYPSSNYEAVPNSVLTVQEDGNMVIYKPNDEGIIVKKIEYATWAVWPTEKIPDPGFKKIS